MQTTKLFKAMVHVDGAPKWFVMSARDHADALATIECVFTADGGAYEMGVLLDGVPVECEEAVFAYVMPDWTMEQCIAQVRAMTGIEVSL